MRYDLITGDDSKSLFGGSCWVPLHKIGEAIVRILKIRGIEPSFETLAPTA